MEITLSKQTIMAVLKSLISSRNTLQEKINLENNSTIKGIFECELAEIDEALEIFDEIRDEIVDEIMDEIS